MFGNHADRRRLGAALVLVTTFSFASGVAFADPHGRHDGFRDHGFHDRGFRDHGVRHHRDFDARVHHYHHYPRPGVVFSALPAGFEIVVHRGIRLFFGAGVWYGPRLPGSYVVVTPPVGAVISSLPPYYTIVWHGAVPYYLANDVYYRQTTAGYTVVPAPVSVAPAPAAATGAGTIERLFVYPRNGQSQVQQTTDREQCGEWATGRTGYDPRFGLPPGDSMAATKRSDYRRAIEACLDGRGYTVR
ncbi:MAG: hypothetical protein GC151_12580 [Betaproteobacteria bacterium]|nr:hypothetical protein [Betaproteobacteria bacterium]